VLSRQIAFVTLSLDCDCESEYDFLLFLSNVALNKITNRVKRISLAIV